MKRLSLKAGLGETTVRDIIERGRTPSIDNFVAIADALGVSPAFLLQGEERMRFKVPTVGIVSGGEGWTPVDGAQLDPLEFDFTDHDVIGLEVRGDSMSPVYRDGDYLVCHRRTGQYVHNLIGCDCIIRTKNGDNYVKILKRGSRHGLFTLKSYNPVFDDIDDVAIEWAAPIVWIKRSIG